MKNGIFLSLVLLLAAGCKNSDEKTPEKNTTETATVPVINYAVTASLPHDTTSYTEGLLFHNGDL